MRRMRSALPSANIRSIGPGDTERSSDCRHRNVRVSRLNFLSINLRGESASWGGSHVWVWRSLCAATKSARASERLDAHDARPNGLRSASQTFRMDGRQLGSYVLSRPFPRGRISPDKSVFRQLGLISETVNRTEIRYVRNAIAKYQ